MSDDEISERIGEPLPRTWTRQDITEIKVRAEEMWNDMHPRQPAPAFRLPENQCDNDTEREARRRWLSVRPGDIVLDIGSADGAWAIPAAMAGAVVMALDCNENTRLTENCAKEDVFAPGWNFSVTFHQMFAFSSNGVAEIQGKRIPAWTIDSFVLSNNIRKVDFVKIDVEGHELEVLKGMFGTLVRDHPDLVIEVHIETVPSMPMVTVEEVKSLFAGLDYRFEAMDCEYNGGKYAMLYATARTE